ncbi:MAG: hypothetical protein R2862_05830 [Thermoanaerobaculia bacterium]
MAEVEERPRRRGRNSSSSLADLNALRNQLHREQIENEKGNFRQRHLLDELTARTQELAEASRELAERTVGSPVSKRRALAERESGQEDVEAGLAEPSPAKRGPWRACGHSRTRTRGAASGSGSSPSSRRRGSRFRPRPRRTPPRRPRSQNPPVLLGTKIQALRGWEQSLRPLPRRPRRRGGSRRRSAGAEWAGTCATPDRAPGRCSRRPPQRRRPRRPA